MGENADSQFSDLVNYGNRQETIGGCGDHATVIDSLFWSKEGYSD